MKCNECGGPRTTERNAVRRYTIGGLPHVELHGIEVIKCETCGKEAIAIPRIGQLHRALAHAFVTQQRMLAPIEIRFLRKHIGLSAVDFAQRMGVSRETVSRWETGNKPIGAVADRLLRLLVVTHQPTESYVVDDFLRELNDRPAPKNLSSMALHNRVERGWSPTEGLALAKEPRQRNREGEASPVLPRTDSRHGTFTRTRTEGHIMAKNEKSSPKLASLASKVLSGEKKPTVADAKKLAASVLTQAPNKKK